MEIRSPGHCIPLLLVSVMAHLHCLNAPCFLTPLFGCLLIVLQKDPVGISASLRRFCWFLTRSSCALCWSFTCFWSSLEMLLVCGCEGTLYCFLFPSSDWIHWGRDNLIDFLIPLTFLSVCFAERTAMLGIGQRSPRLKFWVKRYLQKTWCGRKGSFLSLTCWMNEFYGFYLCEQVCVFLRWSLPFR